LPQEVCAEDNVHYDLVKIKPYPSISFYNQEGHRGTLKLAMLIYAQVHFIISAVCYYTF